MLKRQVAILIAGGLLGAQVGLAAAAQGTFPPSADEIWATPLPAQEQYFAQRAVANPNVLPGFSVPRGGAGHILPAVVDYLDRRAASQRAEASRTPAMRSIAAAGPYDNPFPVLTD